MTPQSKSPSKEKKKIQVCGCHHAPLKIKFFDGCKAFHYCSYMSGSVTPCRDIVEIEVDA